MASKRKMLKGVRTGAPKGGKPFAMAAGGGKRKAPYKRVGKKLKGQVG